MALCMRINFLQIGSLNQEDSLETEDLIGSNAVIIGYKSHG